MQNLADQHSRQRQIVCVLALAGGLAWRVNQRYRFTDDGEVRHFAFSYIPKRSEGSIYPCSATRSEKKADSSPSASSGFGMTILKNVDPLQQSSNIRASCMPIRPQASSAAWLRFEIALPQLQL